MVYSHFKKKALIEVGKREGMTWLEGEEKKVLGSVVPRKLLCPG